MSRGMTFHELHNLYVLVKTEHSPFSRKCGKTVKYIDPHIDMRDGVVFAVSFRGFGFEETCFGIQNEARELTESLYDRCVTWLKEEPVRPTP
jgi:hypothetical protein